MTDSSPVPKTGLDARMALVIGVVAASTAGPLIRAAINEGAPPLVVASGRLLIATLLLAGPTMLRARGEYSGLTRRDAGLAVLSGILLGAHFATFIGAFAYTSVMNAVVLVSTMPIWVGLASPLLLGERNTPLIWIGIFVALAGSVLIGMQGASSAGLQLRGDLLALIGAVLWAAYLLIGRELREKLSLLAYVCLVYGTAALLLLVWSLGQTALGNLSPVDFAPIALVWIALVAIVPQLVGHTATNHAMRRHHSATWVALAALGEPIGATIIALALFKEVPGMLELAGAVLILAGITIGSLDRGNQRAPDATTAVTSD